MIVRTLFWLWCCAALAGCVALTPDYERPAMELPEQWVAPVDAESSVANAQWFDVYADPVLVAHIRTALAQNQDLAVAMARIAEARQIVRATRANQYPIVDLAGGAGRGRNSQLAVPGAATTDNLNLSAGFSLELDLWRRLSRATEATRAELLSTEAAYRAVTIELVADVAATYFLLLDLDRRLQITRETVAGRTASLTINRERFRRGAAAELDANQAEIQLAIAEVASANFERQIVQTENALQVLLGDFPGTVSRGRPLASWELDDHIPAGLPSELLQRRPDIVAAEQALVAETARIGVAEAARWPSLRLTGNLGTISNELADLATGRSKAWDLGTSLFAPIFNSSQLKAQAEAQRARTEQALRRYEATIRQAFREVEDALIAVRTLRDELAARLRQVVAARNAVALSRARYQGGVVAYLEVLDSERSQFSAELDLSATRQALMVAYVRLYEALGGGWTE